MNFTKPLLGITFLYFLSYSVFAGEKASELSGLFKGKDGCLIVYNLKTRKRIVEWNEKRCKERISPCSTFKIPLALMAFDQGLLKDETTQLKWDGKKREIPAWNQNHTAKTWMQNSVVWYSQELTPRLGIDTVKRFLSSFHYGNQDMSGGLTQAWLNSSLKISAREQIEFLEKFWNEKFPISKNAYVMTKKITRLEQNSSGAVFHAKTGSGIVEEGSGSAPRQMGWFVGHLESKKGNYLFALNYTDLHSPETTEPGGRVAKAMALRALLDLELF